MLKRMRLIASLTAAFAGLAAFAGPASAQQGGVNVGTLTCNVASGFGFIFGSSRALNCTFSGMGRVERYTGAITKFGADIGFTSGGVIVWTVVAPVGVMQPGALAGAYAGATASATVGVGLGANVLVGGSNNTVALQPLSIAGNTGLNVAAGIASITLTAAP
jgi:hypothetical protein